MSLLAYFLFAFRPYKYIIAHENVLVNPFLKIFLIFWIDKDIFLCYTLIQEVKALETFERIRLLRKQHLKLSQEQFGEQLGVSRTVIKNIELGTLARPEQKEPLYRLICETFHVSYKWLTSGDGEMLVTTKKSFVEKLSAEYGLSFTAQKIIECYLQLDEQQREAVDDFIKTIAESVVGAPGESSGAVDEALDKTMSIYRVAESQDHTEHEIIKDGKGIIDKLSQIPPVTDKENF